MSQPSSQGSRERDHRRQPSRRSRCATLSPSAALAVLLIAVALVAPVSEAQARARAATGAGAGTWSAQPDVLGLTGASPDGSSARRLRLAPAPRLEAGARPGRLRSAMRPAAGIIDTTDRSAVATAYLTRYRPQFSVSAQWTGSVADCRPGTVAAGYATATLETVNYFRNLAGLPDVAFAPSLDAPSQAAALIMQASGTLTHAPTPDMPCYSEAGYAGASHANLCLGCVGPGAITAYMQDVGTGNAAAGHRRWILFPPQTTLGAGSTTQANALYVLDWGSWVTPSGAPEWVSWPPPGYVPYQHVYPRFTLSRPGADFGAATARVTLDGTELASQVVYRNGGYGDPAIVIEVDLAGLVLDQQDRTFEVTVDGIDVGGATLSHAWESVAFVPDARAIAITPGHGGFGTVAVGASSAVKGFAIRNDGGVDLHLGTLHVVGDDPGEFEMTSDQCSGRTLGPGAACAAKVVFAPTTSGDKSASLAVPSDAEVGPAGVPLEGAGSPGVSPTPGDVTATGISTTRVRLTWGDVAGETGYRVRRQEGSDWPVVRSVGTGILEATDGGRAPGTRHVYQVCAVNASGERCSTSVVGWTRPAAPDDLAAQAIGARAIRLTWGDVAGERGSRVRRQDGTAWPIVADGLAPGTTFSVDRDLEPFTLYRYRVCAWNVSGETCAGTSARTLPRTVIVDDRSAGFTRTGSGWIASTTGYRSHSWWAPVQAASVVRTGTWEATLPVAGRYRVEAYLPPGTAASRKASYVVRTADGTRVPVVLDQATGQGSWVSLGTYDLGTAAWVRLIDRTGEATGSGRRVGFDAVRFVPLAPTTASLAPGAEAPAGGKSGAEEPSPDPTPEPAPPSGKPEAVASLADAAST